MTTNANLPLLEIKNLAVGLRNKSGTVPIVKNFCMSLRPGERVGITGPSGSGKSLTVNAILGLLPKEIWEVSGEVLLNDFGNILECDRFQRRMLLKEIFALIPQDTSNALNPHLRILDQFSDDLIFNFGLNREAAKRLAIEHLKAVGITGDIDKLNGFPGQYSGGMRQRVVIAMLLSKSPRILIADEPGSSLDAENRRSSTELIEKLSLTNDTSLIYISHDPRVLSELCDKLLIMDSGEVVESGEPELLFESPKSRAGKRLLNAVKELQNGE